MTATDAALVVKIGGGEGLDLDAACDDLARIADERSLVIVHGVSAIMDSHLARNAALKCSR